LPRRLGIIGTFVWDTVWTLADQAAGRPLETWGGVSFSVASAAATRGEDWEIVPIAHVGRDLLGGVHAYLDTVEGVGSRDGIVAVSQPNNRVELVYTDDARRGETMRGGVPGWTWDELEPRLEGLDAVYVNFLSGWELDLATARHLRGLPIPVYADLHSLFLGPPRADGPREPRPLPRWGDWLRCFHAVQVNEEEYAYLLGQPLGPDEVPARFHEFGVEAAFVTLGREGAAFSASEGFPEPGGITRRVRCGRVATAVTVDGGDPTGCGDAWGAAVFCGLLDGLPPERAVRRANAVAAAKLGHRGGSGLYEHLRDRRAEWAHVARDD
jgi:sugar/nucleoside kinase (ribokinase family)